MLLSVQVRRIVYHQNGAPLSPAAMMARVVATASAASTRALTSASPASFHCLLTTTTPASCSGHPPLQYSPPASYSGHPPLQCSPVQPSPLQNAPGPTCCPLHHPQLFRQQPVSRIHILLRHVHHHLPYHHQRRRESSTCVVLSNCFCYKRGSRTTYYPEVVEGVGGGERSG